MSNRQTASGVTVAVAKGRILDDARRRLEAAGWVWPLGEESRQLWVGPDDTHPGIIIARAKDVATLVARGIADLGIVGLDVMRENPDAEVLEVADLEFAQCRVVLAGRSPAWPDGPCQIATKYQRIARQFFQEREHPISIVPMSGSLELAPLIGLAPYIVDIVDTGRTLREHGLVEVTTILHSSARLIANPSHWRTKSEVVAFRESLRSAAS
ncbi:MAG: ATP phosphoribosyltransferase [Thermaerobacter sp.]|nr:ATP phosphoribosyltransferase [Thermaerobacter sp.]